MPNNLIAAGLPSIDASTVPLYLGAAYGLFKAGAEAWEWWQKRKDGRRRELDRAGEDARLSRQEAVELAEIQEKTISRLKEELAEAEAAKAKALAAKLKAEEEAAATEDKLQTAARQWFERQGYIDDLKQRLEALEKGLREGR